MFDFENISKANAEMKFTEIHKKNYAEVIGLLLSLPNERK